MDKRGHFYFALTGEAALFNNCAVLHNRTAFEDHDESHLKRNLMRLWLIGLGRAADGRGGAVPQG